MYSLLFHKYIVPIQEFLSRMTFQIAILFAQKRNVLVCSAVNAKSTQQSTFLATLNVNRVLYMCMFKTARR